MTDKKITLQQAIDMGEYHPDYLSTFEEWTSFTKYQQLQFIKQAMDSRRKNLTVQLGELYNVLDLRLKPELQEAIDNIHKHLAKIEDDRAKYYLEYTSQF